MDGLLETDTVITVLVRVAGNGLRTGTANPGCSRRYNADAAAANGGCNSPRPTGIPEGLLVKDTPSCRITVYHSGLLSTKAHGLSSGRSGYELIV